jgi:hypothetical protein
MLPIEAKPKAFLNELIVQHALRKKVEVLFQFIQDSLFGVLET